MIFSAIKKKEMPRVYESDYHRYIQPKYTIANEIRHRGEGIGNEYFRRTRPIKTGDGLVDSALNLGKTALNLAKDNKELISAVGLLLVRHLKSLVPKNQPNSLLQFRR